MITDIHIGLFDVFIFLGVFQGLFLSWFLMKNAKNDRRANLFQGLLLLTLSLVIFEEWLNNTGYIVKVLPISNFGEPLNFAFGPLFYIYFRVGLSPDRKFKAWPHLVLTAFWLCYMTFSFLQPEEYQYNSYISTKHPDWEFLDMVSNIPDDPLGIRIFVNELTGIQLIAYVIATLTVLVKKFRSSGQYFFKTDNETLLLFRNTFLHFLFIIFLLLATKLYYGLRSDIGTYLVASYISFMIYSTSYRVLNMSEYFNKPGSFLSFPITKYQKSSLSEENKEIILNRVKNEMESNSYFSNNLASLAGLSKQINESSHHVSQVINEKLNKNFFELLAGYRVDYAIRIISEDKENKLTVEELAEMVGYNSKSSFNNAFKTITSKTPSEFRKSLNKS